jgi:MarR family 2-MHQ and catechol resistance regulon transcriptional repressor
LPSHHQGSREEQQTLDAYIKLMRASEAVNAQLAPIIRKAGLTVSQFGTLEALHFLGPLRQHEIGLKILKSSGNITMVIDHLEQTGLVERTRNTDDRRCVTVSLTESGERLIAEVYPAVAARIVETFVVLEPEEQSMLGQLCRKLGRGASSLTPSQSEGS